jgi:hypothetical protein
MPGYARINFRFPAGRDLGDGTTNPPRTHGAKFGVCPALRDGVSLELESWRLELWPFPLLVSKKYFSLQFGFWLVLTCFTVIWFVLACFAWVLRFEVWRFSGLSRVASAKEEVWNLEFFPRAALALLPPPRPPGNFLSASGLI